jgi:hypothetical protein
MERSFFQIDIQTTNQRKNVEDNGGVKQAEMAADMSKVVATPEVVIVPAKQVAVAQRPSHSTFYVRDFSN